MADTSSNFVQATLDMLILTTVALEPVHGYRMALRIEQTGKGFPGRCWFAVRCSSAAATSGTNQPMEGHRESQACKVLRPNRAGTEEAQQRKTRMGKASGGDRQNLGDA